MAPGRRAKPKRQRIFAACEGESERGYAAFLGKLADDAGLAIFIDAKTFKGGDHLTIVENAVAEMRRRIKNRGSYAKQIVFLDTDRRGDVKERTLAADRLIEKHGFLPIWSNPTFEAFLLRHLPNCKALKPATPDRADQELQKHWPEYQKGMPADALRGRLDLDCVKQAAAIDGELRSVLTAIGLLP